MLPLPERWTKPDVHSFTLRVYIAIERPIKARFSAIFRPDWVVGACTLEGVVNGRGVAGVQVAEAGEVAMNAKSYQNLVTETLEDVQ